ncbi:hypothetical protein GUJ93_ZPchr0013g37631 [Zizania palustris]|uniref:Uncharacterized protein n=1 Tax=Zizania palustris TaxID=103762 RepID=A0A8J5X964_ZIZPA|nr:hypothetical protein GUJ93_ZPchr0013g37631 [Zizania palustris]
MPSARLPASLPPLASRSLPPLRSPPLRHLLVSSTPGGRLRALRPPPRRRSRAGWLSALLSEVEDRAGGFLGVAGIAAGVVEGWLERKGMAFPDDEKMKGCRPKLFGKKEKKAARRTDCQSCSTCSFVFFLLKCRVKA